MEIILNGEMSTDSDGIIDGNITYLWSTIDGAISGVTGTTLSSTASTITATSIGTYTLTVTDGEFGNTDTTNHVISPFLTSPTIVITPDNPTIGETEEVILTASGASTYLWSPGGETGNTITVSGGTYSVVGTDENSCTGSTTSIVSINNLSVVILSNDTILNCPTQSIELTTTVTGDTNSLQYAWVKTGYGPVSYTDSVTVNSNGEYKVTVTEDVTTLVAEDTIIITGDLLDDQPIASISGLTILECDGTPITLSGSSSQSPTLYEWAADNGAFPPATETGSTITVTEPGTYTLVVYSPDNIDCNDWETYTLTNQVGPSVVINQQTTNIPDPTITITSTVTGGAPSYTYEWLSNTGSIVGSSTGSTVEINASGTLTLNVTDVNGCVGSAYKKTTVNAGDTEAPTIPTVVIANQTLVDSESITVTWNASTDNIGVTNYILTRYSNGSIVTTIDTGSSSTTYIDTFVLFGGDYCYSVKAVDAAGNESSNSLVTTASCEQLGLLPIEACETYNATSGDGHGGEITFTDCFGFVDVLIIGAGSPGNVTQFCALQVISSTGDLEIDGPFGECNP